MHKLHWMKIKDHWEGGPPNGYSYRAKVPGGWLVSVWAGKGKDESLGGGLTFFPDPEHRWDVPEHPPAKQP